MVVVVLCCGHAFLKHEQGNGSNWNMNGAK